MAADGVRALEDPHPSGIYTDNNNMVCLSRLSMGKSDSHSKEAGKVTPESDVN
jgi:hypothetical protein